MTSTSSAIQNDWQNRELIEIIQLNILQVATFLNQFDLSMRSKLAGLNEKLNKLERSLEYCEAAVRATVNTSGQDNDDN
jgi:hypothetical protein